jgi:hypothetical protein
MIIQKLKQIVTRVNPETGEETAPKRRKQYLLLLYYTDEGNSDDNKTFEIITGRNDTFDFLFRNMESIDLLKSHVMSQTVSLEKAITAYSFILFCLKEYMTEQEKVDIEFDEESLKEYMSNYYEKSESELEELYQEELN